MLRMGRNPKDQATNTEESSEQTAHSSSAHGGSAGSSAPTSGASTQSDSYYQASVHTPTTTRAISESESLARDIKEGTLSGFVGNGTALTGEASFKGMLRVDGTLSGRISSPDGTLIVSTNGRVDANIEVAVAQIYGTVNGDIVAARRIEMSRVAKVTGNIQTPALVIENGALFEGSCRMLQLKEASDRRQKEEAGAVSAAAAGASMSSGYGATSGGGGDTSEVADASDIAS